MFHLGVDLVVLPIAGVWIGTAAAAEPSAKIVINEIHYHSADNTVPSEFIELITPSWITLTNLPAVLTNRTESFRDPARHSTRFYRAASPDGQ